MEVVFYVAGSVAVVSSILVITRLDAVHALLYLIVSLLSVALAFFVLGAPFVAALEVIVYAGAIMVLFVFVIMLLNLGQQAIAQERGWLHPRMYVGPAVLSAVLLVELLYVLSFAGPPGATPEIVEPGAVGVSLFGPYVLGVELSGMLLLAGLVGAFHLGRRRSEEG